VAENFLGKWLGRSSPPPPAVEETCRELDRLAAERPGLQRPIGWLREVLPHLAAPLEVTIPEMSREAAHAKLNSGVPLLRGEELPLDETTLARRWRAACDALPGDENARKLAKAGREGTLQLRPLSAAVLLGRPQSLQQEAAALHLDSTLLATLLRFALFPFFAAVNTAWAPHRDNVAWVQGYCPTCGNGPLLGEFRGLEQNRFLRCGWCAASWKVPRLFCPYCGNRDHQQLGLLHREGEETRFRASMCLLCRRYVKQLATLAEIPPLRLWVADVSTLHLDLAAAQEGFHL
jgi:FdhE protein